MFTKYSLLLIFLLCFLFHISSAQEIGKSDRMIDEIKAHTEGLAIWWTGHNGWLIKYNDILIGTDLALESKDRAIPSPISAIELAEELDISFISHKHGDHFERETSKILSQNGNCLFVMPSTCKDAAIEEVGIPKERINVATPRVDIPVRPCQRFRSNGATLKDAAK